MSKTIFAGADLGNHALKLVCADMDHRMEPHAILIPNIVSTVSLTEQKGFNLRDEKTKNKPDLRELDVIIEHQGEKMRYYVGEYATGRAKAVTSGEAKIDQAHIHIPLLVGLAFSAYQEEGLVTCQVGCGLPINQYSETNRKAIQKRLVGEFHVTFLNVMGSPLKTIHLNIENVHTTPEGVAVLLNLMLNMDGLTYQRPELKKGACAIVDIGAFTTDVAVCQDGRPDNRASFGLNEGISSRLDEIAQNLSGRQRANVKREHVARWVEDGQFKQYINGDVDFQEDWERVMNAFADLLISRVDQLKQEQFAIREIYVCGGGAAAIDKALRQRMKQRGIQMTIIKGHGENDVQYQNAYGLYKAINGKYKSAVLKG